MTKKIISILLGIIIILGSVYMPVSVFASEPTVAVYGLKSDNRNNPIGIDSAPTFSWKMDSSERNQYQTAYRIYVSDSKQNLLDEKYIWDSGKQISDKSNQIQYDGELLPSTRYYWAVKIWDKNGVSYCSGEEAFFETGLMNSGWSNAKWIGKGTSDIPQTTVIECRSFSIDVDFIVNTTAFGLVFGATDTDNFYMWQVNTSSNSLRPHCWTKGNAASLNMDASLSGAGVTAGKLSHMKIVADNGKITTYINDIKLSEIRVESFNLGKVGFRASGEKFYVDNIEVKDGNGDVLLSDDFSDSTNPNFSDGVVTGGKLFVDGYLVQKLFLQCESKHFECSTFVIDVDYIIKKGCFGLVFGAKDKNNYYMWQVNASDEVENVTLRPHQWVNGNAGTFGEQPSLAALYPKKSHAINTPAHMTVSVVKGNIKTYINNTLVDERVVSEFDLGSVGLRAQNETFLADNIVVKDGNNEIISEYYFDGEWNREFVGGSVSNGQIEVSSGPIFPKESALTESAPMLRKEFVSSGTVKSAKLYVTSAGIYEMYVNGDKVGDSYLNPGSTQYNKRVMYQTYDITDMIAEGTNAISGMLGKGWFNGASRGFGPDLALLAKLLIEYSDGTQKIIVTDESWHYSPNGPILSNDYFMGEEYDANKEPDGWNEPNFDDSEWLSAGIYEQNKLGIGDIVAQNTELIKNNITLSPVSVTEQDNGAFIYDFGQNFAGIPSITATAEKGTTIRIRYGELLNKKDMVNGDGAEGTLYTENLHEALNTDFYTFKGKAGGEKFEPSFVYHGFRYMEISGIDEAIPLKDIKGIVFYTALEETGTFECSNELINKLYQNTLWSQRSNFMSIPTDCPQRNERWGWTGDAQVFARTASYNSNTYSFFRKYLGDMRDTQAADGKYTDVSPGYIPSGWSFTNGNATSGWGDAGIIIPYQMYMQYGDSAIIKENYESMCKWVNYLVKDSEDFVREKGWTGDWLSVGESTPFGVTDTAFCSYSAHLLSEMAKVIGKTADSEYYLGIAESFKTAWNREFVNYDGSTKCGTQTSYVLGLQFNLFDDSVRKNAAAYLVENIKSHNYHLTTGFLGVSYLNSVLTSEGYEDIAYKLLEQTTSPSWLYSVTTGSTTIWESWESLKINSDGSSVVNSTSFNHYSYGAICEWLYRDVAGIDRDEDNPAFKNIVLKPHIGGSLTYANATYDSVYGLIESDWELEGDNRFNYHVSIPANTTAKLYLPAPIKNSVITESGNPAETSYGVEAVGVADDGSVVYNLASGEYHFSLQTDPSSDDEDTVPDGYTQPSIVSDLLIPKNKCNEYWGNNGNPFFEMSKADCGGLKFSWHLNQAYTLRNGIMETFSLNNLSLHFDNLFCSNANGGNFAIVLTDDISSEHNNDCQQAVCAIASIVLEVDTVDGVIRFANSAHNGQFLGFMGSKGTELLKSDKLKYGNLHGKPFSIGFTKGDNGNFNLSFTIDGQTQTAKNALTKQMLSLVKNLKNTDCLFVALSDFGNSNGVSIDYKLVGINRVSNVSSKLIVPNDSTMAVENYWNGGMLTRNAISTGGMRFRFIDAIINVRQAVDTEVQMDGMRLEFDNFNTFSMLDKQNRLAIMFANSDDPSGKKFEAYSGMLGIIIDVPGGKILQFNGFTENDIYNTSKVLIQSDEIKKLCGKPFSVTIRKTEEGKYRLLLNTNAYADVFVGDIDCSMAWAFDMEKSAFVSLTAANCYNNINFELDWLGIGNMDYIYGDANDDGAVDILDLVHVEKQIANKNHIKSFENADCNIDGNINGNDLVLLLKHLLGEQ